MPGVNQMPREQPAPAADLQDNPAPLPHRLEQCQDPGRAGVGVEAEPEMVHKRQILSVVPVRGRLIWLTAGHVGSASRTFN